MGHTNTTPNYNLPQFLGSDKPAWLTDVNNAMSVIDSAIAAAKAAADNAGGAAAALATTVGGHTTQLETLSNTVTNQGASIVSQGNAINTISELIGNGTPTTTDHTLIGAINELNAKEGVLADLQTTNKSSLVAAINEVAQGGGGSTPSSTSGTHVDLSAYTTSSNAYAFPNDGYVFIYNNGGGAGCALLDDNDVEIMQPGVHTTYNTTNCFVRAGMKIYVNNNQGTGNTFTYIPLV